MTKAVILAAGLGTRMKKQDDSANLSAEQERAATAGMKGMIPVGRPFLDYTLSALAEAGVTEVCLVVGPAHQAAREYYGSLAPTRVRITFAIQPEPRGTADAVLAAASFVAGEPFLVLNSDNYYPPPVLAGLARLGAPGLAGFRVDALLDAGIPYQRLARYPIVVWNRDNILVELQDGGIPCATDFVSMNCWRFSPGILDACRAIAPSPSGELELPTAVRHAVEQLGIVFSVLPAALPVLDLSTRADIAGVTRVLRDVPVRL